MEQQVGQETVPFSLLAKKVAESTYAGLKELCDAGPDQSDAERKINLLKFILKTRQRLLRLLVICKWCRQIPLVERCQQLMGTLSNHDVSFTQAADSLFYLHESLQQSRAPMYDVPSAMEVLLTGSFHRMPKCIEDLASRPRVEGEKREVVLQKLDTLLRSKLLDIQLPREFTRVSVQNGRITLRVDGEFEAQVTLGYRGNASLWRVLHLELLVGESSGCAKFTEMQRLALSDDLERRMAALDEPFNIIYTVLHEFCATLVMDTLCRQVRGLMHGRWKDAIRLDLQAGGQASSSDADAEPVSSSKLKITYWLEFSKTDASPTLRIEPGADQQISCQHQPTVVDPCTGNEAEFVLNQSCIDVENLILKAVNCNIHTRLAEIQRNLKNNANIYKGEKDVILKSRDGGKSSQDTYSGAGEDILYVRAYGDLYISVGISVRNGRFILSAAESLLRKSALQGMEDALNQGTISCVDALVNLRTKSIVHLFATLSASLNLKVYEKGSLVLKFSEDGPKLGPDALILGFPNAGDIYFLAMHLDASFAPQFNLLQVHNQHQTRSTFASRNATVFRRMNIDISKDLLSKDDVNVTLLSEKPSRESPAVLSKDIVVKGNEPQFRTTFSPLIHLRHGQAQSPFTTRAGFINQPNVLQTRKSPSTSLQSPARSIRASPSTNFRSKSPLHHVDNPTSPTDLDADISKLIDSISSKAGGTTDALTMTGSRQNSSSKRPTAKSPPFPKTTIRKVPSEASLESGDTVLHRLSSPGQQLSEKLPTTKRKFGADILSTLPSLANISRKRLKTEQQGDSSTLDGFVGQPYLNMATAANQGKAPLVSHMAVLLHVVKKCWLQIKHARFTSQMESLGISYIEDGGNLIFRLAGTDVKGDMAEHFNGWQRIHLSLGRLGSDAWEVKVRDPHYKILWNLQKAKAAISEWGDVQFAALSEADAHIKCGPEGLVLSYDSVEHDSIRNLLSDLDRLRNARAFRLCMKKLLEPRADEAEGSGTKWESIRRSFKVEAVGLTSLWFCYNGTMPGILARFVVEWGHGQKGCTVHVSPEQLWPHTKYLEDYINGGDVELLLDAIRITAGPLHSLAGAIRPARMTTPVPASMVISTPVKPPVSTTTPSTKPISPPNAATQNGQANNAGRGGIVPSSLLPTDISVLMRSPYCIRIVYRKQFSVDMRCFEGDQVWLQPAPPPQGATAHEGGSLPCPQFRPFVMENVALGLNSADTGSTIPTQQQAGGASSPRKAQKTSAAQQGIGRGLVIGGPAGVYPGYKGELNSAFCGMSDDGGYGGAWVPLAALKKVLRGTLKYLGVLWLFDKFPNIIRDVLASVMVGKEAHLHLDNEQPALRFNIGNCMFAVNMHRHQLYLQGVNVKRFQTQPHQQAAVAAQAGTGTDSDLTQAEMSEIADFFARRVASEPYDASRLASFVTILTFPVSVLREFLGLISWKKEAQKAAQSQAESSGPSKPKIELCLENRVVFSLQEDPGSPVKSSITHDRERGIVEFSLTVFLDLGSVPHVNVNVAGGAGWLPQCVAVKLRYQYGGSDGGGRLGMVNMEGSHGGRACWSRAEDWEKCKEMVSACVETSSGQDGTRLRAIAEGLQITIQSALQQL